jgi:hypothetical protein
MTGDGLLLLPSGGSHDGDESLLLLVCGSGGGLSHDNGVVLIALNGGDGRGGSGLLLIDGEVEGAAQHGWQDGSGERR